MVEFIFHIHDNNGVSKLVVTSILPGPISMNVKDKFHHLAYPGSHTAVLLSLRCLFGIRE